MYLTIFIILLLLSLFFIVLGFSINESTFQVVGFFFLFLLSSIIIVTGNVEYKTGFNESYIYDNTTLINTYSINTYDNVDDPIVIRFGIWMSLISGLGIALSLADIRSWVQRRRASED